MNLRRLWFSLAALLLSGFSAQSEVLTQLSRPETVIGRPVILLYRFVDTDQPENMPESIMIVDGLQIVFQGASQQNNFSLSFGSGGSRNNSQSVFEFTYAVTPTRSGEFTIPGLEVRAGGKTLRTKPAKLRVFGPGGFAAPAQPAPGGAPLGLPPGLPAPMPATPQTGGGNAREGEPFFGELLMTSKPVYVGEVVPVDIRFYFRKDVPLSELQPPAFAGDGFTAVPLTEPEQDDQMIGNMPYRVFTFRSAITALKTGQIEVPAVEINGRIMVASAPPGFDALFDQLFGNLPMPRVGRPEPVQVSTRSRTLKVLPLPKEGRPPKFSGAVGQFSLEASANPASAGPGEPVTLSLQISGRGNFDAMSPPVLTKSDNWRTYAPKEKFQKDDAVGFAGTKTFDFKMVARTDQTVTPGAEFSFFDPRKNEYVTLQAEPQPVDASGRGSSADDQAPSSSASAPTAPEAASAATPTDDIASPAAALSTRASGKFSPSVLAPWFWRVNIVLLAVAVLVLPLLVWLHRRRKKSARASELEWALRQAKSSLQKASDRTEFYNAAAHFVQARLELLNGSAGTVPDAEAALQQHVSDPLERRELQSVLARRDELKYGGGTGGTLGDEERHRIVSMLEKFAAAK